MPEISSFYGIVIKMYFDDHNPPHFHASYSGHKALIAIKTQATIAGKLPPRAAGLIAEWANLHQKELLAAWQRAVNLEAPGKIDPLA